jgi:phosphatidylethanolamine-binding protein (PEBP) family uncharacterized protein
MVRMGRSAAGSPSEVPICRYFYQVVALKEKLGTMSTPAKRDQLAKECEGKVVGWRKWVGVAERK